MIKMVVSFLVLIGFLFLWIMFFKNNEKAINNKKKSNVKTDKEIRRIQSLIEKVEKENPKMVEEIRSRLAGDAKLERARRSDPEDIGGVVKHWLSDEDD